MKLKQWLYGAAALTMLAACSEKDIPGNETGKDGPVETATGYLALQINLPQETQTRADESNTGLPDNVEYADGEKWEYNVEADKAKLILFKTSNATDEEDDAIWVGTYELNRAFAPTSPGDNNITSSSLEAVEVDIDTANENSEYLWALVMLNVPDGLALPGDGVTFGNYIKTISETDFLNLTQKGENSSIFMTNAPLSNTPGATMRPLGTDEKPFAIQTLVKLGTIKECLKSSLQEARENVCGCIYVERALAKLTAKIATDVEIEMFDKDGFTLDVDNNKVGNKLDVTVSSSQFGVLNANTKSYIVRRTSGFPDATTDEPAFEWDLSSAKLNLPYYRMIGIVGMPELYSPLHKDPQYFYRTYWCIDPNYDAPLNASSTQTVTYKDTKTGKHYVRENTFTVANQNYGNSTLAVFEVVFSVGGKNQNLYIVNDNHNAIYTSETDATSYVYEYVLAQDNVKKALKESLKEGLKAEDIEDTDLSPYLKVVFERNNKGIYAATNLTLLESDGFTNYFVSEVAEEKFKTAMGGETGIQDLVQRVNLLYVIEQYVSGKSYYTIPVQHFGDISTPWTAGETNQTITSEAYASQQSKYSARNYLGRYGMVRNNWYELNVTSFIGIGSPVVPEIKVNLSDDHNEIKQYIGIETHILSWAKRTQNTTF